MHPIAHQLWSLAVRLSPETAGSHPTPASVAELQHRLNGGANPIAARHYRDVVSREFALSPHARILDVGCGYGRIALELAGELGPDQHYVGLDPDAEAIAWASAAFADDHPNFSFHHVDLQNNAYNPDGAIAGPDFRFPADDDSLDVVLMVSVMTHVDIDTVEQYLREAARTLKPERGRLIATFFLLDDAVEAMLADGLGHYDLPFAHGPSRVASEEIPELVIAHPRALVLSMAEDAGFVATLVRDGWWPGRTGTDPKDFQDLLIAVRTPEAAVAAITSPLAQPDPEPSADELAAVTAIADELTALGVGGEQDVASFIEWSLSESVDALRRETDGDGGPGGAHPIVFELGALRGLGFRPPPSTEPGPSDSDHVFSILEAAGDAATPSVILAAMLEVIGNGVRLRRAATTIDPPTRLDSDAVVLSRRSRAAIAAIAMVVVVAGVAIVRGRRPQRRSRRRRRLGR